MLDIKVLIDRRLAPPEGVIDPERREARGHLRRAAAAGLHHDSHGIGVEPTG